MNKREYKNNYIRMLRNIERRFVGRFYKAIKSQLSSFTENGFRFTETFNGPMLQAMQDLYVATGTMLARKTLAGLRKEVVQKRTMGFSQEWTDEIIRYFRENNLFLVQRIDETTRRHILAILERGTQEGLTVDEMSKLINDVAYMRFRAARIVRTESTRAANFGIQQGAQAYEYEVLKEWLAISDNRTRHSHREVDGQQREMDEPFSNGCMFPGDPAAPAKETISCRCVQVIEPKRDSNGRLIPKSRISVILPGNFIRSRQTVLV